MSSFGQGDAKRGEPLKYEQEVHLALVKAPEHAIT